MPRVDSAGNYRNTEGKVVRKATASEKKAAKGKRGHLPRSIKDLRNLAEKVSGNAS